MTRITYQNVIDGQRHLLIDDVTEAETAAVLARFGNREDRFMYLPGLRVEED